MTKVGRLFEEEKIEYANRVKKDTIMSLVKKMLTEGEDIIKIMKYSELTKEEVLKIQAEMNLPDVI